MVVQRTQQVTDGVVWDIVLKSAAMSALLYIGSGVKTLHISYILSNIKCRCARITIPAWFHSLLAAARAHCAGNRCDTSHADNTPDANLLKYIEQSICSDWFTLLTYRAVRTCKALVLMFDA